MYTVKLPGAELKNLRLNGSNFISDTKIDDSVFEDLSSVSITDSEKDTTETYTNLRLVHNIKVGDEFWFAFEQKSTQEIAMEKFNQALDTDATDITNIQMAMAEIYEMLIGGM